MRCRLFAAGLVFQALLLLAASGAAAFPSPVTTTVTGSGQAAEPAYGMAVDTNTGSAYVTANILNASGGWDIWVGKYNSSSVLQSSLTISGPMHGMYEQYGNPVAVDGGGSVYLTGTVDSNVWVARYSSSLVLQSSAVFNATADSFADKGYSVAVDQNGNAYVIGTAWLSGRSNIWLGKFNSAMVFQSSATVSGNSGNVDYGCGITMDATGNVYAAGMVQQLTGGINAWVGKYNSSLVLQASVTVPSGFDTAYGVTTMGGNVYVTGAAAGDIQISKYDASLVFQASATVNGPGNGTERGNGISSDGAGNIYLTGYILSTVMNADIWVGKYDASLVFQSSAVIDGSLNAGDVGKAIAVSGSSVYVVGNVGDICGGLNLSLTIYGPSLTVQSSATFDSPGLTSSDEGLSVSVALDGSVYATGSVMQNCGGSNIWVGKYNSSLVPQAEAVLDGRGHGNDFGLTVSRDGDGNIYIGGYVNDLNSQVLSYTGLVAKYDPSLAFLSSSTFGGSGAYIDRAWGVTAGPGGDIYVAGALNGDAWVGSYNPSLVLQTSATINGSSNAEDLAYGVAVATDGAVYITGFVDNSATGTDILLAKYTSSLVLESSTTFNGPVPVSGDYGSGLALGADGNIYMAGGVETSVGSMDIWLGKFDPYLVLLASAVFDGSSAGYDEAYSVAADQSGRIFVTGSVEEPSGGSNLWVAQFNSSLVLRSSATIDGPSQATDGGNGIATDGSGRIYSLGTVTRAGGGESDIHLAKFLAEAEASSGSCGPDSRDVRKDGGGDSLTIQGALSQLPSTLTADTCVVIRDTGTYAEQVTVQGFANNGFRLSIMADPAFVSSGPVVSPPALSTAAFRIFNASVTLQGLSVLGASPVPYGILVSSADVNIASVNVISGGKINVAGVALTTRAALSYSSVTVQNAHGVHASGSRVAIAYSTVTAAYAAKDAVYFDGVSSGTITRSNLSNPYGSSLELGNGASFNTISLSSANSGGNSAYAAVLMSLAYGNTLTQNFIYHTVGPAAVLASGAGNTISFSTMASAADGHYGLSVGGSSNTITNSNITYLRITGSSNTVSLNTMIRNPDSPEWYLAASLSAASGNTLTRNYIPGNFTMASGSAFNTVSLSTITGRFLLSDSSSNTLAGNYHTSPSLWVLRIDGGVNNLVSGSTIQGTVYDCVMIYSTNTVFGDNHVFNPSGHGVRLYGHLNTVTNSTITGAFGLSWTGSTNTVRDSYLQSDTSALGIWGSTASLVERTTIIATYASGSGGTGLTYGNGNTGLRVLNSTLRGAGTYGAAASIDQDNSGTLEFSSVTFEGGGKGLEIALQLPGTQIFLSSATFRNHLPGATPIVFGSTGTSAVFISTFTGLTFAGADIAINMDAGALDAASRIAIVDSAGPRTGSAYANDPQAVITWLPDQNPASLVWDGGGTGNNASEGANWAGDAAPQDGDSVRFDGTDPVKFCNWDLLNVSLSSFTMTPDFSTSVVMSSSFSVTDRFYIAGGTFSWKFMPAPGAALSLGGNFEQTGGYISGNEAGAFTYYGLRFNGTGPQTVRLAAGSSLPRVTVTNPSTLTALSGLRILDTLSVSSGTLDLGAGFLHRVGYPDGITGADGYVKVDGGTLEVNASTLTVGNGQGMGLVDVAGGILSMAGGDGLIAISPDTGFPGGISVTGGGRFISDSSADRIAHTGPGRNITIQSVNFLPGGRPGISGLTLDAVGLYFEQTRSTDVVSFSGVNFTNLPQAGVPGADDVAIYANGMTGDFTFSGASFDLSVATCVYAYNMTAGVSTLSFVSAAGPRAGAMYENDPGGVVFWNDPAPGCQFLKTVRQAGGGDCTTIQACIDIVPAQLTGNWCVDIQDSAEYAELPVIQNKDTNGFRLTVGPLDSVNRPTVYVAGPFIDSVLKVANSSVTIQNLIVKKPIGFSGILVSSPNVLLDQVYVEFIPEGDIPSQVSAGISISSWTTVTRSSITANSCYGAPCAGLLLTGEGNVVSFSTVTGAAGDIYASVWLSGASSNTITQASIFNGNGHGVAVDNSGGSGSNYNTISYSTIIGAGPGYGAVSFKGIANTITESYLYNGDGVGVWMDTFGGQNISNTVSKSTIAAGGFAAVYAEWAEAFTLSQSMITNPAAQALWLSNSSGTISQSTVTSSADGLSAVYIQYPLSVKVVDSYVQGSSAVYISAGGLDGVTIRSSVLVAAGANGIGLSLVDGAPAVISSVTLYGGGLRWDGNAPLSLSSITFQGLKPGTTAIDLLLDAQYLATFDGVNFSDPNIAVNINGSLVDPGATGSELTILNAYGPRSGPGFENDPQDFISWPGGADVSAPAAVSLVAYQSGSPGVVRLAWGAPGDDADEGSLSPGSAFLIQYSTEAPAGIAWSTTAAQVAISTSGVAPAAQVSATIALGLNEIYFFRLWTVDEAGNWSAQSSTASAYNSPFALETIYAAGNTGAYSSLAVDRNGDLHLASREDSVYGLKYFKRTGQTWSAPTVIDSGLAVISGVSLALAPDGLPAIAYGDSNTRALKYAKFNGASWTVNTVDGDLGLPNGGLTSKMGLSIDAAGRPHLAYNYENNSGASTVSALKYATFNGISWSTAVVETTTGLTQINQPAIALDAAGRPHISYAFGGLKYAVLNSGVWSAYSLDAGANKGWDSSIVVDGNGNPRISYHNYTPGITKYAEFNGLSWSTSTIDNTYGYRTSLALDGAGKPHVSYYAALNAFKDLRYAMYDGNSWLVSVVDSSGDVGNHSSLAISGDGEVHISYYDTTGENLKAAHLAGAGFQPPMSGNSRGLAQAPDNFRASAVYLSSITWSWSDNSTNELGFAVYGATSAAGPFSLVAGTQAIPAGTASFTETGLNPGTAYFRYAAAVSAGGAALSSGTLAYTNSTFTVLITPLDMAPEDPLPLSKTAIGLSRIALYRGDGFTENSPSPVPMLRLSIRTVPEGAAPAYLQSVRVRSSGTLSASDISYIGLYADSTGAGQLGLFEGETVPGGSSTDIFISTGSYSSGSWSFDDLDVKYSTPIVNAVRNFFLAVRVSTNATTPGTFGLAIDDQSSVVFNSSAVVVGSNNFPIITATSPVRSVLDITSPTVSILLPQDDSFLNSLASITGTAADNMAVSSVTISLKRQSDDYYWNGTAFAAAETWFNALVSQSSWTYSNIPGLVSGSSYMVRARAMDASGNWSAAYSTSVFYYDTGLPFSAVSAPTGGAIISSFSSISGTAADPEFIVGYVVLRIQRALDGAYWNGALSQWTASPIWNFAAGTSNWEYAGLPQAALTSGATYLAVSKAIDAAVNLQVSEAAVSTFTFLVPSITSAPSTGIGLSSMALNWGTNYGAGTTYYLRLSTTSGPAAYIFSGSTTANSFVFNGLTPNTGYYGHSSTSPGSGFVQTGYAVTLIEPPADIYFDEVEATRIVASAYAPTPAFHNLDIGQSGTNVAISTNTWTWAGWHGEKWTAKTPMPTARTTHIGVVSGKLYAVGGSNATSLNINEEYNPVSDNWVTKASMPTSRWDLAVGVVGGKLYALGGYDIEAARILDVNEEYDPLSDVWVTKRPIITARLALSAAVIGGEVLVFGGKNGGIHLRVNESYLPASNTWVVGSTMPVAVQSHFSAAINGKVYVMGGDRPGGYNDRNDEYDSVNGLWSSKTAMPTKRRYGFGGVVGGKIYTFGGSLPDVYNEYSDVNEEYDPVLNTWTARAKMPTPRSSFGVGVTGGRFYVIGGYNNVNYYLNDNEEYDPGVAGVFSGLSPNTLYTFKAKARNQEGIETAESILVSTYTMAAIPAAPSLTAHITSATLNWGLNDNPAGTEAEISRSTDNAMFTAVFTGAVLAYEDTGLQAFTTYYYRVRNFNSAGVTTGFASAAPARTRPPVPLGLSLEAIAAGVSSITWSWSSFTYADGYRLLTPGGSVLSGVLPSGTLSWTESGLSTNTPYSRIVETFNISGSSGSAVLTSYTSASAPGAPGINARTDSQIQLNWASSGNPAGTVYQLWSSTAADLSEVSVSSMTVNSHMLSGLAADAAYYFKVRAMNGDGVFSAFSATVSTSTLPPLPAQAAAPSVSAVGISSISWIWAALGSVSGYNVYPATAPSSLIASPAAASYTQEGLSPNTTYSILVAGVNIVGEGPVSSAAPVVATLAAPPSGTAVAAVFATSATLTWDLNGNPSGTSARVQRVSGPTGAATGLSYTDTGLLGCTSYYYRVWNVNAANISTDYDEVGPAFTGSPTPLPPGNLSAESLSGYRIALAWEPAPFEGITGYNLYYDNGTGTIDYGTPLAALPAGQTSYTTGMLTSVHYKFGLRALHRCGVEERNTGVRAEATGLYSLTGVRAAIKIPQSGKKVSGNSVTVMAGLVTGTAGDTKNILLQYKASASGVWLDIPAKDPAAHPNPDPGSPYFIHWDVTGLASGSYDLRAVASDPGNASDPFPAAVTISIDPVEADIAENVAGGKVTKEQKVNNLVANTLQAADPVSTQVTRLEIPAGALDGSTATVSVTNNPALVPPAPADAEAAGVATEITLSNQSLLAGGQTAAVTLVFPDADNNGILDGTNIRTSRLEMYSAHSAAGPWLKDLSSTVDLAGKKVIGHTSHFSFFALFAPLAADLNSARAYPVPWKPGSGGKFDSAPGTDGIIFDNLTDKTEIRIYTITGQLVRSLKVTASDLGFKVWDGRNSSGKKAASGVYLAHIKSGSKSKVLKIAVER